MVLLEFKPPWHGRARPRRVILGGSWTQGRLLCSAPLRFYVDLAETIHRFFSNARALVCSRCNV
jgi:hypothetical protein